MKIHRSKLANILTASRFPLSIVFALLFSLDTTAARLLLLATVPAFALSDWIDGPVARRLGSVSSSEVGSVLDSMADDFAYITASICLLSKGLVPMWLVLLVLWTRSLMVLVRLLTAVRGEPYAGPRLSTKAKGVVYVLGLACLLSIYSLSGIYEISTQAVTAITQAAIGSMAIFTFIAAVDFFSVHRRTLLTLFMDKEDI